MLPRDDFFNRLLYRYVTFLDPRYDVAFRLARFEVRARENQRCKTETRFPTVPRKHASDRV